MVEQVAVAGFDRNFSYVIHDGTEAFVVDPTGVIQKVFVCLEEKNLRLTGVFITHLHFDHYAQLQTILKHHKEIPIYMHTSGLNELHISHSVGVDEGTEVMVGSLPVTTLYTPGHTNNSVCYYSKHDQTLITGDTLFVEGAGRVSSEKDAEVLYTSVQRLKTLPEETKIFPGHDYGSREHSTLAWEKEHNRFFLANDLGAFKKERL